MRKLNKIRLNKALREEINKAAELSKIGDDSRDKHDRKSIKAMKTQKEFHG